MMSQWAPATVTVVSLVSLIFSADPTTCSNVPPLRGPWVGHTPVTEGRAYRNWLDTPAANTAWKTPGLRTEMEMFTRPIMEELVVRQVNCMAIFSRQVHNI